MVGRRSEYATEIQQYHLKIVAKVKEIVNTVMQDTTTQIASIVCMSLGAAHNIFKLDGFQISRKRLAFNVLVVS
jgi:hypothetical protein